MTRIFCSTNHCGFQAAQLEAALRKRMQGASHAATTQAGLFEEEVRG